MKASVFALVAILVALVPSAAHAGTYDVQLCADPQDTGFVVRNDSPVVLVTNSVCPPVLSEPFSGVHVGVRPGTTGMVRGTSAAWTVTAPTGTSFDTLRVQRRLAKSGRDYEVAVLANGSVVDGCSAGSRCDETAGGVNYDLTREVTFRVACAATTCGNSEEGSRAWLTIESARATIDDPAPPAITPPALGKWQRTPEVAVTATDASGIASVSLRKGDQPLGSITLPCDFRHLRPCPGTGATVSVDLPDGTHALTATATDAAGQATAAAIGTLMLDRHAPDAPEGLAVQPTGAGFYTYTWRNPDQGTAAPIVAAHLSDGTVVRGEAITQLTSASPVERIHLEDAAGNADPASAVGLSSARAVPLNPPILQDAAAPRIKLSSARRSGTKLIVKGTVANATSAKVTATVARGSRSTRKSAGVRKGKFTITLSLSSTMRRKGSVTLTVKYGSAKATKRLRFR